MPTYAGTPADFNLVAHERAVASSLNEPSCTAKRAPAGDDGDEASLLSGLAASAATAAGAGAGFGAAGFATGRPVSARASAASRSPWSWYRVSRPACRHPSARAPVQPQRRHRMPAVRRARRLPVRRTRHRRAVRPPCAGRFGMSMAMSSVTGFGCESSTIGNTITAATTSAIAPTRRRRARCFSGRVGSRSSASDSGRSVRRERRSTRSVVRSVRTFRRSRCDRRAGARRRLSCRTRKFP